MKITAVNETTLGECVHLFRSAFSGPPWNEDWLSETAEVKLRQLFHTPGFFGLLARAEGLAVGMLMDHFEQQLLGRHFQIKECCVLPDCQRRGVGRALVRELYRHLATEHVTSVSLITMRDSPAHQFYEQNGFRAAYRNFLLVTRDSPKALLEQFPE